MVGVAGCAYTTSEWGFLTDRVAKHQEQVQQFMQLAEQRQEALAKANAEMSVTMEALTRSNAALQEQVRILSADNAALHTALAACTCVKQAK